MAQRGRLTPLQALRSAGAAGTIALLVVGFAITAAFQARRIGRACWLSLTNWIHHRLNYEAFAFGMVMMSSPFRLSTFMSFMSAQQSLASWLIAA